jgi:hypothetical protein
VSDVLRAVWTNKALWGIHVVANAALLAAIYGWLWIPDQTAVHLLAAIAAAIAILLVASWLHASTLEHFRINHESGEARVRVSFKPSKRRIGLFALWLVVLCAAIVLVLQLNDHLQPTANRIASALTLWLRRPFRPVSIANVLSIAVTGGAFILVPLVLLQLWNRSKRSTFLLIYVGLFLICAYLPYRLIWWVPTFRGLYGQAASMTVRFGLAYLLSVTGWLVLASTLGRRRIRRQASS